MSIAALSRRRRRGEAGSAPPPPPTPPDLPVGYGGRQGTADGLADAISLGLAGGMLGYADAMTLAAIEFLS